MGISRYFERTLFYDLSPAAEEFYERSADTIFLKDQKTSQVEVRVQSSIDALFYDCTKSTGKSFRTEIAIDSEKEPSYILNRECRLKQEIFQQEKACPAEKDSQETPTIRDDLRYANGIDDASSLSSKVSSTTPPTALDHHRGSSPPIYPGPPKLTTIDLDTSLLQSFVKHTQHSFRVFYVRQKNSFSRLQVTKSIFEELLESCHVFPRFKEYVIGLGLKSSDSEVTPLPLKFRPLYASHNQIYHGFECSYLLRYAEHTNRGRDNSPYSIRQFAIYNRYKLNATKGCSTWILMGSSARTEKRVDEFTHGIDDLMLANPFELHTVFLDTAIASWLPFLRDLDKIVTQQSKKVLGISLGSEDESDFICIDFDDHQIMKEIEDQIADTILCLDSMLDTVEVFGDMYEQFCEHHREDPKVPDGLQISAYGTDAVVFGLKEKAREINHTRKIAGSLLSKVQNTRTLISSLLEREEGHSLQKLAKQGQDENAIMRKLAEKTNRDSSSMRILTIITMIYLPCTIVSNFYSTQFVEQKELPSGGTKLEYTQNAYIFFAISVPLTLLTIFVWYVWVNSETILQSLAHWNGLRKVDANDKDVYQSRQSLAELPR